MYKTKVDVLKRPVFVISLDCEGRWGMADQSSESLKLINQKTLNNAYKIIFETLSDFDVKATMAFTTLFASGEKYLRSEADGISNYADKGYSWYKPIKEMLKNNDYDGWLGDEYFKHAISLGHEIAWHGFSHHVISDETDAEIIKYEVAGGKRFSDYSGININSVVYPRNVVGQLDFLASNNFRVYRNSTESISSIFSSKYARFLEEFNVLRGSQEAGLIKHGSGIVGMPSGHFLNWPSGFRSFIPDKLTVFRWKSMIDDSIKKTGYVHMWFHPHNLITAPRMQKTFVEVIKYVSKYIKNGDIENMTMKQYADK